MSRSYWPCSDGKAYWSRASALIRPRGVPIPSSGMQVSSILPTSRSARAPMATPAGPHARPTSEQVTLLLDGLLPRIGSEASASETGFWIPWTGTRSGRGGGGACEGILSYMPFLCAESTHQDRTRGVAEASVTAERDPFVCSQQSPLPAFSSVSGRYRLVNAATPVDTRGGPTATESIVIAVRSVRYLYLVSTG